MPAFFLRNRIKPTASPGMATQDAPEGKETSVKESVNFQRFHRIARACGLKTTARGQEWGNRRLVKPDGPQKRKQYDFG